MTLLSWHGPLLMELHFFCKGSSAPTEEGHVPGGVGVYLHGQAEDECRFDIPDTNIDLNQVPNGVHAVSLNGNPGYTLFLWRSSAPLLRGLVVKDTDGEGLDFAREKFAAQPHFL